ncbi:MAG: transaldolase [Rhodospirillales bacterium]|nr:transaldolase [Rhodospirillales bacterium]
MSNPLSIKLFMDGADIGAMTKAYAARSVQGFTTNPTLMKKAGIRDYEGFARQAIAAIPDLPISFEVFSDDFPTMEKEARAIAGWGGDTYIKVPVTNTQRDSAVPLIRKLSAEGFSLNVTAILTLDQVKAVAQAIDPKARTIVSVFAGRIADTGRAPVPIMAEAAKILKSNPKAELLWASPRELLNVFEAQDCGCHILTATPDILAKLALVGKDLDQYSLETVKMFYADAQAAGFKIV